MVDLHKLIIAYSIEKNVPYIRMYRRLVLRKRYEEEIVKKLLNMRPERTTEFLETAKKLIDKAVEILSLDIDELRIEENESYKSLYDAAKYGGWICNEEMKFLIEKLKTIPKQVLEVRRKRIKLKEIIRDDLTIGVEKLVKEEDDTIYIDSIAKINKRAKEYFDALEELIWTVHEIMIYGVDSLIHCV